MLAQLSSYWQISIRQTQTVFQSTAEFDIIETIIKENKMLLIRLILLYCVFIINGRCSDINFDQFKSEFESMKTHIVSMESRIELLKIDADQCKIKTEALTEELRIHKDEINTKITEAEAKLETLDSLDAKFQEYVELSSLMTVVESCLELANHGITTSKEYDLDPDGINRQILLVCHKNK